MGDREGNYLEACGMAMFACSFVKGANMGHLPQLYKADANTAFDGFVRDLIKNVEDGEPLSTQVCALAGLGG